MKPADSAPAPVLVGGRTASPPRRAGAVLLAGVLSLALALGFSAPAQASPTTGPVPNSGPTTGGTEVQMWLPEPMISGGENRVWGIDSQGHWWISSVFSGTLVAPNLPAGETIVQMTASRQRAIALLSDGSLWTWYWNELAPIERTYAPADIVKISAEPWVMTADGRAWWDSSWIGQPSGVYYTSQFGSTLPFFRDGARSGTSGLTLIDENNHLWLTTNNQLVNVMYSGSVAEVIDNTLYYPVVRKLDGSAYLINDTSPFAETPLAPGRLWQSLIAGQWQESSTERTTIVGTAVDGSLWKYSVSAPATGTQVFTITESPLPELIDVTIQQDRVLGIDPDGHIWSSDGSVVTGPNASVKFVSIDARTNGTPTYRIAWAVAEDGTVWQIESNLTITQLTDGANPLSSNGLTATSVTFDGISAASFVSDGVSLKAVTPPHAAGPVDVVVETVYDSGEPGPTLTYPGGFTYIEATVIDEPIVVSVSGPDASGWEVTGTGVPGATVTLAPVSGAPVTTTVAPDGSWSATVPLSAGAVGDAVVTQELDGLVSASATATLEGPDAPAVTAVSDPDASGWEVTGTGVPGATVTLAPVSGAPVTTTVAPDGSWSVSVPLSAGAVGDAVVTQELDGLVSASATATLEGPDAPAVTGVSDPDASGWEVTGTGVPGATVTVAPQSGAPVTATVGPTGTWSVTVPSSAGAVGDAAVTQKVGVLVSPSASATLDGIDAPTVTGVSDPDASGWEVTGTGVPGATVTVAPVSGAPVTSTVGPTGTWSVTVPPSAGAVGDAAVTQKLGALESDEATAALPVLSAPVITDVEGPTGAGWLVSGTGAPGATLTVHGTDNVSYTVTVGDDHTWAVQVPTGTQGPVTAQQALGSLVSGTDTAALPGLAAPAVTGVSDPDASGWDVAGTGVPGATVTVAPVSGAPVTTTVASDGTWSVTVPPSAGAVGDAAVTQKVGALVSPSVPATLEGFDAPTVTGVSDPDASGWEVTGTGIPGATVTVTPQSGPPVTTTVGPTGTWSVTVPPSAGAVGDAAVTQKAGSLVSPSVPATLEGFDAPTVTGVSDPDASGWEVTGTGIPGATVTVTPVSGPPVTATVGPTGTWSVTVPPSAGAVGDAAVTQKAGSLVSPSVPATLEGFDAPTVTGVSDPDTSGWEVTGTGIPGATVTLTPVSGPPVTATVSPTGTWSATVPPSATGPVDVTQESGTLVSPPERVDLPEVASPTVDSVSTPDEDGWTVTGHGVPGAVVTLTPTAGDPITATVGPTGVWTVTVPPTTRGPAQVIQSIGDHDSAPSPVDLAGVPPVLVDSVSDPDQSGWTITGRGVPGATVTVIDDNDEEVTVTVAPDGTWSATLPLSTQGPVDIVQALGGDSSTPVKRALPALAKPIVDAISPPDSTGVTTITGRGVPGAVIVAVDKDGSQYTAVVQPDGTWTLRVLDEVYPLSITQELDDLVSEPRVISSPDRPTVSDPPADGSGLAHTGSSVDLGLLGLTGLAMLLGVGALLAARRRSA